MKKIICLAFLSFNLLANAQGAISLPELSILYAGYQNKIEVGCSGMESCEISLIGGTATKSSWTDQNGMPHSGYLVSVASGVAEVSITLSGENFEGQRVNVGTYQYKVKPFPKPQISGTTISKLTGFIAYVSLGPATHIAGNTFEVTNGTIGEIPFSGKIVPASSIAKLRVGEQVGIDVFFTHNGEKSGPISAILTVVE